MQLIPFAVLVAMLFFLIIAWKTRGRPTLCVRSTYLQMHSPSNNLKLYTLTSDHDHRSVAYPMSFALRVYLPSPPLNQSSHQQRFQLTYSHNSTCLGSNVLTIFTIRLSYHTKAKNGCIESLRSIVPARMVKHCLPSGAWQFDFVSGDHQGACLNGCCQTYANHL